MKIAFLLVLAACGGTITNGDKDAGAFCTGTTPKLVINGADVPILQVTAKGNFLNCCQSAELTLATAQFQALMNIMWRAPPAGTATIDLANPPSGFGIEMDLGCDPATSSCATASPEERYFDEGFSGTLQYATGNAGLDVSYCLQIAESPSQPHSMIHTMALYAPNVASP